MPAGRRSVPDPSDPRYVRPPDEAYELDKDPDYRQHQAVNEVLTNNLVQRLTGRGKEGKKLYGVKPSRQYFGGVLASQYKYREAQEKGDAFEDIAEDVAPFSIGCTFRLPADIDDDAELKITPEASTYYRRFPEIDEQEEYGNEAGSRSNPEHERAGPGTPGASPDQDQETVANGGAAATEAEETSGQEAEKENQTLLQVFERADIDIPTRHFTGAKLKEAASDGREIRVSLDDEIDQARTQWRNDDRKFRERKEEVKKRDAREIPAAALSNESDFQGWQDTMYAEPVEPLWEAELRVRVRETDDELVVTATLVNMHGHDYDKATDYEYSPWRAFLFDVGVEARVEDSAIVPFQLDEIRDEYQYDGRMYAVGESCAATAVYPDDDPEDRGDGEDPRPAWQRFSATDEKPVGVRTVTIPIYKQAKYIPREPVPAPFDVLAGESTIDPAELEERYGLESDEPVGIDRCLKLIEEQMEAAEKDYRAVRDDVVEEKSDPAKREYDKALKSFEEERQRFKQGRQLIEEEERVRTAFKELNQTFLDMGDFPGWRLFQIVFIVMSIPDIVKQADPDREVENKLDTTDIIYYPTGGGKTEAYLGLVTFTAFHDRLRGKSHGVTAFTKFPLRFLSLQQLERAAVVLAHAELIRMDRDDMPGDPFSLGYLVGSDNTPNKLMNKHEYGRDNRIQTAAGENGPDEYQMLSRCPFCGKDTVTIGGDIDRARIDHVCTNPECQWVKAHSDDDHAYKETGSEGPNSRIDSPAAPLPVYIADREIYRHVPTFIVGTIDKISIMGMQRRFRTLVGRTKYRCPDHGYTGESRCLVDDYDYPRSDSCDSDELEEVEQADPPSLIIQDELHLLREEFGAFDSHYETFLDALIDKQTDGQWRTKVVAATATIESANHQVNALYRREGNRFPSQGPRLKQSFYAYAHPHRTGRRMLGIIPRSVTRTFAINKIHEEYARVVQDYAREPERLIQAIQDGESDYELDELDFVSNGDERRERLLEILDQYEVQISYHFAKDNTQLMKRSVHTMINRNLASDAKKYDLLRAQLMTGETDIDDVRAAKEVIEAPPDQRENPIHMVIATSMISHGVDIDRFNFIGFHGAPRQTAEYIQSYSRVGRSVPGTVCVLYHPMQVRDQSYYQQFHHYHEYEDLLVEATPLERWAQFAVEQTMAGIVCGALFQYYDAEYEDEIDDRLYNHTGLDKAHRQTDLSKQDIKEFVMNAYDVADVDEDETSGAAMYERRVAEVFDEVWRYLLSNAPEDDEEDPEYIPNILQKAQEDDSKPGVRYPMMNLRDIDEQIPIEMEEGTAKTVHLFTGNQ